MKHVTTTSFQETQSLGESLAKELHGGEVVALYGDLGAGKTTFVQGLAKGLGITKHIISPTFIIMRTYDVVDKTLYHVDLYRIEKEEEFESIGLLELMQDPEAIIVIEWPEKIENLLPENRIDVIFAYVNDATREITITKR